MAAHQEIELDIEELTRLSGLAERPNVKKVLLAEIECLKKKFSQQEPKTSASAPVSSQTTQSTAVPPKYYKDITTYAWDQSEKFMKLYVTVNGVQKLSKENVTTEFTKKSFRLRVENLDGVNYQCHVAYLWGDIVPAECYHKVKTDSVLVMLKKADEKKTWAYVTEREDNKKKTPKLDEKKDPNESLMDLLKQMYDDGDDEMKRTIAKSFAESRNKTGGDF